MAPAVTDAARTGVLTSLVNSGLTPPAAAGATAAVPAVLASPEVAGILRPSCREGMLLLCIQLLNLLPAVLLLQPPGSLGTLWLAAGIAACCWWFGAADVAAQSPAAVAGRVGAPLQAARSGPTDVLVFGVLLRRMACSCMLSTSSLATSCWASASIILQLLSSCCSSQCCIKQQQNTTSTAEHITAHRVTVAIMLIVCKRTGQDRVRCTVKMLR